MPQEIRAATSQSYAEGPIEVVKSVSKVGLAFGQVVKVFGIFITVNNI